MAMSFVGNDFLPHGMTLKLKDGGHDRLLAALGRVRKQVGPLMGKEGFRKEALVAWFSEMAATEEQEVQHHCAKKIGSR